MSKKTNPKFTKKEVEVINEALQYISQRASGELSKSVFLRDVPEVMRKAKAMDSASEKVSNWYESLLEQEKKKHEKRRK